MIITYYETTSQKVNTISRAPFFIYSSVCFYHTTSSVQLIHRLTLKAKSLFNLTLSSIFLSCCEVINYCSKPKHNCFDFIETFKHIPQYQLPRYPYRFYSSYCLQRSIRQENILIHNYISKVTKSSLSKTTQTLV